MKSYLFALIILLFPAAAHSESSSEESIIDLKTFLQFRTHQYPIPGTQIYLMTPLRTGSTLLYNVLRFLFENEDHEPWFLNHQNLVVKTHYIGFYDVNAIHVFTMRDPVDACLSHFRVMHSQGVSLDEIVKSQIQAIELLEVVLQRGCSVIVLKYEEFSQDFDYLFTELERALDMEIESEDKAFLKKALDKKNVIENIAPMTTFVQYDDHHLFHGLHIDQAEYSQTIPSQIREEIRQRVLPYSHLYEKWGYVI